MTGILHPQYIGGRVEWRDSGMDRVIDKIQNGDPVHGWEGDDRLAVYRIDTPLGPVFELMRLDEDGEYRRVVKTNPGDPFDDAIIVWLCQNDRRRKPDGWSIADDVDAHNAAIDAEREAHRSEWVAEEIAPRLIHALNKDGM